MEKNHKCKDPFFSRHYLDIYGSRISSPDEQNRNGNRNKKPVVIFLTGGAWIIGYRMWGTLLGRALAPFGILVIAPDYRNFPQVNIEGMVQDIDLSIQWVFDHVEDYGGDKEKVVLVGQSAGAHIGGVVVAMKVLDWLRTERRKMETSAKCKEQEVDDVQNESRVQMSPLKSTYSVQQLCGFISTSSPHNLVTMRPVFHHLGLNASLQRRIFGGLGDDQDNSLVQNEYVFEKWSPYHLVMKSHMEYVNLSELSGKVCSGVDEFKDIFPRCCVIHGTLDKTVPVSEAIAFISLLKKLNIHTVLKMYEGWSHTDPILEAPMRGNHSYHRDIYELTCLWTERKEKREGIGEHERIPMRSRHLTLFDERHPMLQPICPSVLVEAARFCNPF
eukprot:CAMPEP_0172321942 /NCGR_PEP_ID=MMETSP1058-20130122/44714_1 /TAXON_ID=83371 /ORGANISM="Detonula confervacea, Strain CCMP 353" /LENGTH=386 /DNA_ID=CAMNT_0013037567 /DNA_START=92 /DNA_END=1252 /DNA_ORIENTATION=-